MLAGLAGALAAPVRSLTPGMGFSVLIESFIVTVIGGMGSILGALIGALPDRPDPLVRISRLPLFTEGPDLPVHGDRAGVAADRPVRQESGMTELRASPASETLAATRREAVAQRSRYRDVLITAFAILAILPLFFGNKALLDFVIRCSAFGLFATSLNLLVGYTGMISFGHGMFFGLGAYSLG